MLEGLHQRTNLTGVAKAKSRRDEIKAVPPSHVESLSADGWVVDRKNKRTVRMRRPKPHGVWLEDRLWTLLYRMGFDELSGQGGSRLLLNPKDEHTPKTQIDVVALDEEVALAVECKSSEKPARRPQFAEELGKHALIREPFARAMGRSTSGQQKRQAVLVMACSSIMLSDADRARAKEARVALLDEKDLSYYEALVGHLGPAARYQFLADLIPGQNVPGLTVKIPAIRTKMAGKHCFTFSISPEYLLKISYVSHRAKGKASDIVPYQRMLNKRRLARIREYVNRDGVFPTNIVINIEKGRMRFDRIAQQGEDGEDPNAGILGWLEIRPCYRSAWIIDGQHRLYAYSGHPRAQKSVVSVLAFEGLDSAIQAQLFIDINSEQKRVKQSLLQELYSELRWNADKESDRVGAIVAKAVLRLDEDADSPFYHRIQSADDAKDPLRCLTLTTIFRVLNRPGFFIEKEKQGKVAVFGPLWAGTNEATLERTVLTLRYWFDLIRSAVPKWWDLGSGPGGGIAMNDAIVSMASVLLDVLKTLEEHGQKPAQMENLALCKALDAFGSALGQYLKGLSEDDRRQFRELRGVQGQTTRTRRCEWSMQKTIPSFNPSGLSEFIEREKAQTNARAREICDRIELLLKRVILDTLKAEFGQEESEWWAQGVPKEIRILVGQEFERDDRKRGNKEHYFNLIHYRAIVTANWQILGPIVGYEKHGSGKEKRTSWIVFVNEKRNLVMHPTSSVVLSIEEVDQLRGYLSWFEERVTLLGEGNAHDEVGSGAETPAIEGMEEDDAQTLAPKAQKPIGQ